MKKRYQGNGIVPCWPTTVGLWQGMTLPWNKSDRQNGKKKLHDFVLNNEATWKRLCRCSIYIV